MPSTELNVDVTTAPFHLVVLALLVIVAAEPKHWYSKAFDIAVVALCGLSGPFAYILAPIALLCLFVRRRRFTAVLFAVLVATIPIQLSAALTSPRFHETLGASLHNLVLIAADRVILAGFFAEEGGLTWCSRGRRTARSSAECCACSPYPSLCSRRCELRTS